MVKLFMLFVLLTYFSFTWGQENKKLDSLVRVYQTLPDDTTKVILLNDLFGVYIYKDPAKAKEYVDAQFKLSKKLNYEKGIGTSYHKYSGYYQHTGKIDSAKIYAEKALALYEKICWLEGQAMARFSLTNLAVYEVGGYDKQLRLLESDIEFYRQINDSVSLGRAYLAQGVTHMGKGNYKIALSKNIEALKILENRVTEQLMGDVYRFLAIVECELQHSESAIAYALKALEIFEAADAQTLIGRVLNTMGITYDNMDDFKNADAAYERAYAIAREQNNFHEQKLALINHSRSYEKREDYSNAMIKLKLYLELDENSQNKNTSSRGLLGMGTALVNSDRAMEGKDYLDRALVFAKKENAKGRIVLTYLNRARANAKLNDYKSAYEDYQMYVVYNDSVFNETKSQQIEEMRAIFDTEKKEQQIARQETEIALLEEKEKVSRQQKWLLGGGLGFSLLVVGFGFYGFWQKIKRNQSEKQKLDAELTLKKSELDFKMKELTTHAIHLAKKNEVLETVKQKVKELKTTESGARGYQQLIQTITFDQQDDKNWENFIKYFEQVHKDFSKTVKMKYAEITTNELRLMALLKMNLSSKEIANILNISPEGIKKARYRLRKKLDINTDESLQDLVLTL